MPTNQRSTGRLGDLRTLTNHNAHAVFVLVFSRQGKKNRRFQLPAVLFQEKRLVYICSPHLDLSEARKRAVIIDHIKSSFCEK
jgi:hypothetical protein